MWVAAQAGQPDADPFDLLCHRAFNAPVLTRQRADRMKKKQADFFSYLGSEAREILNLLLERCASDGELQFTLPDVQKLPAISHRGNESEIIGKFGGTGQAKSAVKLACIKKNEIQNDWWLYEWSAAFQHGLSLCLVAAADTGAATCPPPRY